MKFVDFRRTEFLTIVGIRVIVRNAYADVLDGFDAVPLRGSYKGGPRRASIS